MDQDKDIIQELLIDKNIKHKKAGCPFMEKLQTVVTRDGEEYQYIVYVVKKRKPRRREKIGPNQRVWEYYKRVKHIAEDDINANETLLPRFARDIVTLLKYAKKDILRCFKAIEWVDNWSRYHKNKFEWHLGTVCKKWYEMQSTIDKVQLSYLTDTERHILRERGNVG